MVDEPAVCLAVLWRQGEFKCEYWKAPGCPGRLRLRLDAAVTLERTITSTDDMQLVADAWRDVVIRVALGDTPDASGGRGVSARSRLEGRALVPALLRVNGHR